MRCAQLSVLQQIALLFIAVLLLIALERSKLRLLYKVWAQFDFAFFRKIFGYIYEAFHTTSQSIYSIIKYVLGIQIRFLIPIPIEKGFCFDGSRKQYARTLWWSLGQAKKKYNPTSLYVYCCKNYALDLTLQEVAREVRTNFGCRCFVQNADV